jgi:DNA sulfur modification protein DndE
MPIDNIRLSQEAREQLIALKRRTRIRNWNVLCRWGFCASLAEPSPPPPRRIPADSSVEMTWKVFGGRNHDIYLALLKQRCLDAGLPTDDETLAQQLRLHLHRGIGYLKGDPAMRDIRALIRSGLSPQG